MAYFVEDGKSLITNVGIKQPHEEVNAKMCGHKDDKTIGYLCDKGILYEAKVSKPEEAKAKAEKAAKAKPPSTKGGGGSNPGGDE